MSRTPSEYRDVTDQLDKISAMDDGPEKDALMDVWRELYGSSEQAPACRAAVILERCKPALQAAVETARLERELREAEAAAEATRITWGPAR